MESNFVSPKYPSSIIYDASVENLLFISSILVLCISTGIPTSMSVPYYAQNHLIF